MYTMYIMYNYGISMCHLNSLQFIFSTRNIVDKLWLGILYLAYSEFLQCIIGLGIGIIEIYLFYNILSS